MLLITDHLLEWRMFQSLCCSFPMDINPIWPQMPPSMSPLPAPLPSHSPLPTCCITYGPFASCKGAVLGSFRFSPRLSHCTLGLLSSKRNMLHISGISDLHLSWGIFWQRELWNAIRVVSPQMGPTLGFMVCCHHPEIFNTFLTRGPTFSF